MEPACGLFQGLRTQGEIGFGYRRRHTGYISIIFDMSRGREQTELAPPSLNAAVTLPNVGLPTSFVRHAVQRDFLALQ
jgi:hypothetical protein